MPDSVRSHRWPTDCAAESARSSDARAVFASCSLSFAGECQVDFVASHFASRRARQFRYEIPAFGYGHTTNALPAPKRKALACFGDAGLETNGHRHDLAR